MDYLEHMPFKDEEHLDEEVEDDSCTFDIEQERRYQELIKFIDDFINSDEIKEHIRRKDVTIKANKSTQWIRQFINNDDAYNVKDVKLNKDSRRTYYKHDSKTYPLTGISLRARHKERHERLKTPIDDAHLKKQLETIEHIRVIELYVFLQITCYVHFFFFF